MLDFLREGQMQHLELRVCVDTRELEGREGKLPSTGQATSSSAEVPGSRTGLLDRPTGRPEFYFYPSDCKAQSTFFPDNLDAN